MELSKRDIERLKGVHPALISVVKKCAELSTKNYFIVTEGLRTVERQKELVAKGFSQTMNSKHITGHAVDLAVWFDKDLDKVVDADELSWKFEFYKELSDVMKKAAKEVSVDIEWGGDWTSFKDGPHFQINPNKYKF